MELQFNKSVIPCLRTVLRDTQSQEQTQEVRLSDGMPDIGKILSSWGQVIVRGKEWHSTGMNISGGVMAWVMYMPEDGTEPRCVETWLPFQMDWDFPQGENDGYIQVKPLLRSIDSRLVSARKMTVRSVVSILAEAMVSDDAQVYSPGDLPEDICILKNTYPVQMPVEFGEKAFTLEDTVSLSQLQHPMGKLIRYQLQPELLEQKIMADKVVFRGNANLHILYRGTDEMLHSWDFEIPFSQFGEITKELSSDCIAQVCFAVTNLELEPSEGDGLNFKIGLTGQYVVYDNAMIEIAEDAYSPVRQVLPQGIMLQIPAVLDRVDQVISPEQTLEGNAVEIADVAFYPDHPRIQVDADGMTAQLGGNFHTLYYDENGSLQAANSRWNDSWSMRVSNEARVEADVVSGANGRVAMNGLNPKVQGSMQLGITTWADGGISMMTGVEAGEVIPPDPNRPSLILCRMGDDTLWSLAKRTGSTVDAIKKANRLETEPDSKKLLLIPVS